MLLNHHQPLSPPAILRTARGTLVSHNGTTTTIGPARYPELYTVYTWSDKLLETHRPYTSWRDGEFQATTLYSGDVLRFGREYYFLDEHGTLSQTSPEEAERIMFGSLPNHSRYALGEAVFYLAPDHRVTPVEPGLYYSTKPLRQVAYDVYATDLTVQSFSPYYGAYVLSMQPLPHMHRADWLHPISRELRPASDEACYSLLHYVSHEEPSLYGVSVGDQLITDGAAYVANGNGLSPFDREVALRVEQIDDAKREFDLRCGRQNTKLNIIWNDAWLRLAAGGSAATSFLKPGLRAVTVCAGSPAPWLDTCDGHLTYRIEDNTTDVTVLIGPPTLGTGNQQISFYPEAAPFVAGSSVKAYVVPKGTLLLDAEGDPLEL